MLPKIITGWQSDLSDFFLGFGVNKSNVLNIDGEKLPIEDLRDWLNFCENLTKTDNKYVILLENADLLSVESQNILLKPLEEKKPNVEMYLLVRNENKVLPTILSRCELVSMKKNALVTKYWTDLVGLWKSGPVAILNYCEKFSADEFNDFLREILVRLRLETSKGATLKRLKIINCFIDTASEISVGNVNKRLAMENLLFRTWRMIKTQ